MKRWIQRLRERRRARLLRLYRAAISDIELALQQEATRSTAAYVRRRMRHVQSVDNWRAVHDLAISRACLDGGLVLEFGVCEARTTRHIAAARDWHLHGFDSFEGLPEPWRDGYPRGALARREPPAVPGNVTLHVGLFERTLPDFLAALPERDQPVRYLHVDSDLYSSARTVLDHLGARIVPGTVIVFDEYFNHVGWEEGEFRAFREFVAARGLAYDYLTYNRLHQQVALRIA